jgi:hypothetical protein
MTTSEQPADLTQLDDSALISMRAQMREELERLPPASPAHAALTARYDQSTQEIDDRARKAWSTTQLGVAPMDNATQAIATLPKDVARMLAVEILLADPEDLHDDVLESCLYLFRERLRAA